MNLGSDTADIAPPCLPVIAEIIALAAIIALGFPKWQVNRKCVQLEMLACFTSAIKSEERLSSKNPGPRRLGWMMSRCLNHAPWGVGIGGWF